MLILASASKARQNLLDQLSYPYKVIVSEIDESKIIHSDINHLVQLIAKAKAENVISKIRNSNYVNDKDFNAILACDSLFEFQGEIFGKPINEEEALYRWRRMSSGNGILYTGYYFSYKQLRKDGNRDNHFSCFFTDVISTKIEFDRLTNEEITWYVKTKEPMNCAGGFALEGKGSMFIKKIEGCYTNVIGLSLPWLRDSLKKIDSIKK